ncbi:unnamed protein product, partial [Soboliphyme baturini]|uniref:Vps39_1 domain-containing protein n=1 Tax=Soboliphyme baturini TaxID=241478 RepID=A0A183J1N3_9BILA
MLVASLLRLSDNSCNTAESERVLLQFKKFSELFLLYERKGLHVKALNLLKEQADVEESPLNGLDRSIHYLQNLGQENADVVFHFAKWIFKRNPREALKIFTEDCETVKELDRSRVLAFLVQESAESVIVYLEHIIDQWNEEEQKYHNFLAEMYISKVKCLYNGYSDALRSNQRVTVAGEEPGELGVYRRKLLNFLSTSERYNPEILLVQLPFEFLFEERAVLLGRLRRHEQVLAIYCNILHDFRQAEQYCSRNYRADSSDESKLFLKLLKIIFNSLLAFTPRQLLWCDLV